MTPSVLQSVDAVAAAARLRDALVDDHRVLPEIARPLARAVAAQGTWIARFAVLYSQSGLGPFACMQTLRSAGLIGEARHGR